MRAMKILAGLVMLLMFAWLGMGCSNPDNFNSPTLPDPGKDDPQGDPIDPDIPVPFSDTEFEAMTALVDLAFEKDGDLVLSDSGQGLLLFDPLGKFKRNISNGQTVWTGLVDVGPGVNDSGKSIIVSGPPIECAWKSFYDDAHVTGGAPFPDCPVWGTWWGGEAHPPSPACGATTSSGEFGCTPFTPQGIDLHPIYGWLFLRISHTKVNTDPDCGLEPDKIPENWDLKSGIMAVHPLGYRMGADIFHWEGSTDYVVYHNKGDVDGIDAYGYPMASTAVEIFCWDETMGWSMLPPRDGIATQNISDFEFDAYGRMIVVVPNGNSFAITNPVVPPDMIVTQRIIGGASDGTSHAPGDFYGPRGVAVDPRNQEIYITDTGLNRVQVFDNQGTFLRMFGTGVAGAGLDISSPTAIEIDSFGNVYIAVANDPLMVVVNEFGEPISYGSIEGYARDKTTGVALDNVIISIASTYREFLTVTNEQGFFRFSAVPQGAQTLLANRTGYKAAVSEVFVTGGHKTTVTLYMERTGVGDSGTGDVTGKLISSLDGDPLGGLLVTIKGLGITDTSSGDGTFHLYKVPEGDRVLQVLSNSIVLYEQDVYVNADAITPLGYVYLPL